MIVERDGVALNAVAEGEGSPVVLLHGHTLDLRVWDGIAPALARAGFRAVRYDQRGHGRSSSPPAGYRWGDHAADLAAVVERLASPAAHLVGLSKGAGIALECALRRPELVRSLVLVGPLVPDRELPAAMVESFRALARAIRSEGVERAVRGKWLAHPLIAPAAARPGTRERHEAMVLSFPAGEYLATARDAPDRDWKVTDRLPEIAVPTLVLRGEAEVPEFADVAEELAARISGARSAVVPGSGHLVPLEAPAPLTALLLEFLRGLETGHAR